MAETRETPRATITPDEYLELQDLLEAIGGVQRAEATLVSRAQAITGDHDMNGHTFDVCMNDSGDADDLLARLNLTVERRAP